jgi:hypothetical protein
MSPRQRRPGATNTEAPEPTNDSSNLAQLLPVGKLALQPVAASQLTSEAVYGLNARRYREIVKSRRIPHIVIGKLVVTEVSVMLAALRAEQIAPSSEPDASSEVDRIRRAAGVVVR